MRTAIVGASLLTLAGAAHAEHWDHLQTHLDNLIDRIDVAPMMNSCQDVGDIPPMFVTTQMPLNGINISYNWTWTCQRHVLYVCQTQNCFEPPNSAISGGDPWTRINPPVQEPAVVEQPPAPPPSAPDYGNIPTADPSWAALRDRPAEMCQRLGDYAETITTSTGARYSCQSGSLKWEGDGPPPTVEALAPPPPAQPIVTCAWVYDRRACRTLDEWRAQAATWCERAAQSTARRQAMQARGYGSNRLFMSPASAELSRELQAEAVAGAICAADHQAVADAQAKYTQSLDH